MHVAGEHLMAGAAPRLRPVHRGVRVAQHVLRALVPRAGQCDAHADAGEHLVPAHNQRVGELLVDPIGDADGVRLGGDVVEQDGELVAAQPRQRVARPQAALQPPRGADQQLVAGLVSQAVVDRLEAIEIEVQHREQRIAQHPPRAMKQVLQAIDEQRAVREIRERIVEGAVLQLLLGLLALGDVARDPEGPDDLPVPIAQRQLGGRDPADVAVRAGLLLLDVHQRLAGPDDLLFVAQRLRGVLLGEEVEVGATDGERRVIHAEALRRIAVDAREAAVPILEVDAVRDVVHQRRQQEDLVGERRDVGDGQACARPVFGRLATWLHAHRGLPPTLSPKQTAPRKSVSTDT